METKQNGKKSLVVQDFTFGKYLGKLNVIFDDNGELLSWKGNPLLLNDSYVKDDTVSKMVESMKGPIIKERNVSYITIYYLLFTVYYVT